MSKVIGIEYSLKDANTNEQLDTNVGQAPLEFVSGKGQIIEGLEKELLKMELNEKSDVLVEPSEAYGEYDDSAVQKLPKEQFAGIELVEGMTLYGSGDQGQTVQVVVKEFNDDEVTIDYNHPMAGRKLLFTVTIVSLRDATVEEIETGFVGGVPQGGGCCGGHGHSHGDDDGGCCGGQGHSHGNGGGCGCSH